MDSFNTQKTIVVTGATAGIGLACAELLARAGCAVIGVGRSAERCRAAESRLRQLNPDAPCAYIVADLALQPQVRALADSVRQALDSFGRPALDGLVNNAGTFTYWLELTAEGFEKQWAVNHLAGFLLTHELLPLLRAAPCARVVTVSSASHYGARLDWDDPQLRRRYNGLRMYGQTKLANVLDTLELNQRLGPGSTVRAFAADPGLVKTDIGMKGNPVLVGWVWRRRAAAGSPAEQSARGIVYLATEPSIQDSGEVYWKHGKPQRASQPALDAASAARLWALSARMCGLDMES